MQQRALRSILRAPWLPSIVDTGCRCFLFWLNRWRNGGIEGSEPIIHAIQTVCDDGVDGKEASELALRQGNIRARRHQRAASRSASWNAVAWP